MTVDELAERGIRVKPLEWGDTTIGWPARGFSPPYRVSKQNSRPEIWSWGLDGEGWAGSCSSLEAAKAAAEADHAARLAAQLECSRDACEGPGVTG